MEDKGIYVFINRFKWIIPFVLVIVIVGVVGVIIYNNYMVKKSTNNLTTYLLKEGFKKNADGSLTKSTSEYNNDIQYVYSGISSSIYKNIIINENGSKSISLIFKNNYTIDASLTIEGTNKNGKYGTLLQSGSYNVKNSKFECKVLINDNFDLQCSTIRKEILTFKKEVKEWIDKSNSNMKFIA